MQKMKAKDILVPCITLFLICMIVTACLVVINSLTKDTIAKQEEQKKSDSCKLVLSQAKEFEEIKSGDSTYYVGKDESGEVIGYSFITSAKGYGGDISVMTGISSKDDKVTGVVILSQNETPGLGANAEKETFTQQYKSSVPDEGFSVVKSSAQDGQIQALTGATISTNAVTDAVNSALEQYKNISE
ncbi:MAG: RnfABCDGE type electron transport complex subunit G [Clostridia bacterium]|nr:RnfABCDGE type electron transport complex subunit G [Clostridia bacterium]